MSNCQWHNCKQQATIRLLFTSGMHGNYCTPHALTFDQETVEDFDVIQPLDELWAENEQIRQENERIRARIAVLDEAIRIANLYLTNSTPVNAVKLNDALRKAREEKQE